MPGALSDTNRQASDESDVRDVIGVVGTEQHRDGSQHIVHQGTANNASTMTDFPTAETRLEEGTTNSHGLQTERCDPREIICCGGLKADLANR